MIVQKLFSTEKKQFTAKPPYKKPVYKSYKELLQLDRPRKKIEQSSQSQDEDFLQKLLNAQNEKAKLKKKRKKSLNSARKRQSQQKMRQQNNVGKEDVKANIPKTQIKLIRQSQTRGASAEKRISNDLSLIQEEKHENLKQVETKSTAQKIGKQAPAKSIERKSVQNEPIYIDNKSIESLPFLYSSTNHLFHTSLGDKKNSAYNVLIRQKEQYLQQFKPKESISSHLNNQNKIQHNLNHILETKFSFRPNIQPVNPNWRYNLTIAPQTFRREKEFVDRKTLFRSKDQQQRFIKSLRQISRKKK